MGNNSLAAAPRAPELERPDPAEGQAFVRVRLRATQFHIKPLVTGMNLWQFRVSLAAGEPLQTTRFDRTCAKGERLCAVAMQKVVGASPIIRSSEAAANVAVFVFTG
jgi:hypothetical protein